MENTAEGTVQLSSNLFKELLERCSQIANDVPSTSTTLRSTSSKRSTSLPRRLARLPSLTENQQRDSNSDDDFMPSGSDFPPLRFGSSLPKKRTCPVAKRKKQETIKKKSKLVTKEMIMLPHDTSRDDNGDFPVPRSPELLSLIHKRLVAKIAIRRTDTKADIEEQIQSVFGEVKFQFLQILPGHKTLIEPLLSKDCECNGETVLSFSPQGRIYALALEKIMNKNGADEEVEELLELDEKFEDELLEQEKDDIPYVAWSPPAPSPTPPHSNLAGEDAVSENDDLGLPDISFHSPVAPRPSDNESLPEIILRLASVVDEDDEATSTTNIVNLTRNNILDCAIRAFKKPKFDNCRRLSVNFTDEDALYSGGPRKEFMTLTLKAVMNSAMFEGQEYKKYLALNYEALSKGWYEVVGRMLAYFIVHRGPSPNFLSNTCYIALVKGLPAAAAEVKIDDIVDETLKTNINIISRWA